MKAMRKTAMLGLALATTFAASPVFAQDTQHPTMQRPTARQQASAPAAADQAFVKQAIQGNLAEVQLGKLAQQRATDPQVRQLGQLGQMLATDHQTNNEKARTPASGLNITPPTEPNSEQKQMYQKLSGLSGATFDHQFVTNMIADHRRDIAKFSQKEKSSNPQVAQYAQATLPDLQKHLHAAEAVNKTTSQRGR